MTPMSLIEVSEYFAAENSDYRGIPFVEVWPRLTTDHFDALMGTTAVITEAERRHDPALRMQYAQRIFNIFLPTDEQIDFALKLWNFILMGYEWRWRARQGVSSDGFRTFLNALASGSATSNAVPFHRDSMWFAACIGTPGTGKTSTPLSFLSQLAPGLLYHPKYGEVFQLLHAHLKAPKNAKEMGMALAIFYALRDVALKTNLPFPYRTGSVPKTIPAIKSAIKGLCEALNLGLLIIDEVDHLFPGTQGLESEAMKFLTDMSNIIQVPTLLIGTWELLPKLGTQMPLARRSVGAPTAFYRRLPKDDVYVAFAMSVFSVQATTEQTPWDTEIEEAFYEHTQGIHDLIVKLHALSQIAAIAEGTAKVDAAFIVKVAKECRPAIAPCIKLLKEGRKEQDREVWDLEPEDFAEFVTRYLVQAQLKLALGVPRSGRSAANTAKVASDLTQILHNLGVATQQAVPASLVMAQNATGETAEEIAAKLIQDASRRGPKPSRSKNEAQQIKRDAEFEPLDASDLRRIVYFAIRTKTDVESSLRTAGYIPSAADDVAGF